MVNGHDHVYVERRGRIERSDVRFESEQQLRDTIERILAPVGRRVDELSPMADARLADGSRVNVVIPARGRRPRSLGAPIHREPPGPRRAGRVRNADRGLRALLADAVGARRSILVSGGQGRARPRC